MKVVLFCGGQGIRLRELSESIPKPMVRIGYRPILWHVMRYYAHFGHADFICCLGYKADVIKEYFLRYNEALSNDFVMSGAGRDIQLLRSDIDDWRISFVDTGLTANLGQRLRAVQTHLAGEDIFMANYGDVLTDAPLDQLIEDFQARGKIAAFLAVQPTSYSFHIVRMRPGDDHLVERIEDVRASDTWINGGYFLFRKEIFEYIQAGDELVEEPFRRLIAEDQLIAYQYRGFWAPMDTIKDVQNLEQMHETGQPPWAVRQSMEPAGT